MANAAGLINEGLWRKDKEFQQLPRLAQCTFCQVLSQKDLDTAGVLTLHMQLLAKACEELTVEQLMADFAVLEERRFLFVDYDTDEMWVRSYLRLVSVKSPNAWLSVPKNAKMVASEKIRHEMAVELRRVRRKDADALADEIDPVETPSQPDPDPVETPSKMDTPSGPGRDPRSLGLVLDPVSPSVVGSVGEPPPCKDHGENWDHDKPCHACRRRRRWFETHDPAVEKQRAIDRVQRDAAAAIHRCTLCDIGGRHPIAGPGDWSLGYITCTHSEDENQRIIDEREKASL